MKKTLLIVLAMLFATTVVAQSHPSVSILGDSYSTFEGYLEPDTNHVWYRSVQPMNDVTKVTQTWWHIFIKENGYRLCVNNSFSGATICNTGYRGEDYSNRAFINRTNRLGSPDVLFIFGATNDSWAGSPIGEYKYENWTRQELYSFRPAMAKLVKDLQERYPNVELYFILNDGLKEEINESSRTICQHYGMDIIELHNIDKQQGHPSIKGMRQIAEQIKEHLQQELKVKSEK